MAANLKFWPTSYDRPNFGAPVQNLTGLAKGLSELPNVSSQLIDLLRLPKQGRGTLLANSMR